MGSTQVSGTDIRDTTVTDADVASANKDGLPGVFSLRTLGVGSQQAAAGDDPRFEQPSSSESYFHSGPTPSARWYLAGLRIADKSAWSDSSPDQDLMYMLPFAAARTYRLTGLGVRNKEVKGSVNIGVYSSRSTADLTPEHLLVSTGTFAFASSFETRNVDVLLDPGLYWLTTVWSGNSPKVHSLDTKGLWPIMGFADPPTSDNIGVGFERAQTFGAFPTPITAGSLTVRVTTNIPGMLYRLSAP